MTEEPIDLIPHKLPPKLEPGSVSSEKRGLRNEKLIRK
jgi:hypothetical protein